MKIKKRPKFIIRRIEYWVDGKAQYAEWHIIHYSDDEPVAFAATYELAEQWVKDNS